MKQNNKLVPFEFGFRSVFPARFESRKLLRVQINHLLLRGRSKVDLRAGAETTGNLLGNGEIHKCS